MSSKSKKRNRNVASHNDHDDKPPKRAKKETTAKEARNDTDNNYFIEYALVDGDEGGTKPSSSSSSDATKNLISNLTEGWWVFLLVNMSPKASRNTQIKVGQQPELIMLQLNTDRSKEQNMWAILLRIGPFSTAETANAFYDSWNEKSRGLQSRYSKGVSLAEKYHREGHSEVNAWTTSRSKEVMMRHFEKEKLWLDISGKNQGTADVRDADTCRIETEHGYDITCKCGKLVRYETGR